jgi:hypothetical protein
MDMSDYIKIKVAIKRFGQYASEWIWAQKMEGQTAKIANIPFFTSKVGLGDLVEYKENKDGDIVLKKILVRESRTVCFEYRQKPNVEKNFKELSKYFDKKGIIMEGGVPGFAAASFPKKMKKAAIADILLEAPHIVLQS